MSNTITPNMSLTVPSVGAESGPDYAFDINGDLSILDAHDHSPGAGVQITPAGININSALTLNSNFLTNVAGITLTAQSSTPAVNTVYESGNDLFFVDGVGNNVRLTQSGAVAGTPGSIANLVPPASASYVSGTSTFVWQSGVNIAASMDFGAATFRNLTPNSTFGMTLQAPASLGADFTLTLPLPPASTSVVTMDSSGNFGTTSTGFLVPTGSVLPYFGVSAPTGFLMCDGLAVSRTTYAGLFSVISTFCGQGDGSTTFNLPDLQGYFLRGVSGASGRDPDASARGQMATGGNTGNNVGSVQTEQIQTHLHSITDLLHSHNTQTQSSGAGGAGVNVPPPQGGGAGVSGNFATTSSFTGISTTNNYTGSETRPVNAYCYYIIKT